MKKKLCAILFVIFAICLSFGVVGCSENPDSGDTTPRIEFPAETVELEVGQTALITPVLKNTEGTVMWQSSDREVASVDQTGLISANSIGSAVVTAFITQEVFNNITVTVIAAGEGASITFPTDSYTMERYDNLKLSPVFVQCSQTPVWTSSDERVATVDGDGNVIPCGVGSTTVTVRCGNVHASVTVNVEESDAVPTLTLNREEISLLVGGELSVLPTVRYNGKEVSGATVKMTSQNTSVAIVTDGKVKGVSAGNTVITLSACYRGFDFAVKNIPVEVKNDVNIVLSSNEISLQTKEIPGYHYQKSAQITAEVYIDGVKTDKTLTWKSAAEDIASVTQSGLITAAGAGKTEITATYTENGESYTATVYTDVALSVVDVSKREIYLSELTNVTFDVVLEEGETLKQLTVCGNKVEATVSERDITVATDALKTYYGESDILVETDKAIYKFPSLIITKSISTMSELRSIVETSADTLGGYYVLKNNITADSSDKDFRLMTKWSNQGKLGFVGTFDGRGYGIYDLNVHGNGLFNCIGAAGVVKNLALINVTGTNYAIATECRGTIDNVFVSSATKSHLMQMSDDCTLTNSFAILSAENSNVVGTIYSATCAIRNVYGYAGGMIKFSSYSQAAEPTIFASTDVARIREELAVTDFATSGYDKVYWTAEGGTPIFKSCEQLFNVTPEIKLDAEYTIPQGKEIVVSASGYAAISLKNAVNGVALSNGTVTVSENATVTFVATGLWGKTSEKSVKFIVSDGEVLDRTAKRLFDYEIGSESVTFDLPADISTVTKLSVGTSGYFESGFTVSAGKVTIDKALFNQISSAYGDYIVTLTDGTNFWEYTCSFVTKIISSYEDLEGIRITGDTLDGYFVLGRSFVAGNDTAMAKLIGAWSSDKTKGFVGIFDGRGYSITGLKLTEQGLFRCMGQSTVRNLALIDVEVANGGIAVFGDADCQSTSFENIFISTNAKTMFRNAYGNVTVKNVVFVSTYQDGGYLSDSGSNQNNGSYTIENTIVVGKGEFRYYGGTPTQINTAVYETVATMFEALAVENGFEQWSDLFAYRDGVIYFNEIAVLQNNG